MRWVKVFGGVSLAFLFWLAAIGVIVWYEAGATIEQNQIQEDMP